MNWIRLNASNPLFLVAVLFGVAVASLVSAAPLPRELRVLTYDSLAAPEGLGSALFLGFEKKCACKVRVQAAGDAAQILSRLGLEAVRKKPVTQVVVGIDQTLWPEAKKSAVSLAVNPKQLPSLLQDLRAEVRDLAEDGFVPLDWGVHALITRSPKAPDLLSWRDLANPELSKKWIVQDPRTSTPGFAFVWGAEAALKDGAAFFGRIRTHWLTLASGWSASYALFLKGQGEWVWSYTTSQAYHQGRGETAYRAVLFKEGNPIQIEGAFAVKNALVSEEDRKLARQFLEHLGSIEVQSQVPERQWMLPVHREVKLPAAFATLPQPRKVLYWNPKSHETLGFSSLIRKWEGWIRE
ncbi:MAG: thiamine ABC transporter substrate-binding protein [Oligoflexia bacterium]